jgi:hypothetical protein
MRGKAGSTECLEEAEQDSKSQNNIACSTDIFSTWQLRVNTPAQHEFFSMMFQPLNIDLAAYGISAKYGFLVEQPPLARLPDPYYSDWERTISMLPILLKHGTAREEIENLVLLKTDRLRTEAQWRRAYVVLCYLSQAYIQGGDDRRAVRSPSLTQLSERSKAQGYLSCRSSQDKSHVR